MTLGEFVAAFGPVAGMFMFLLYNRVQTKSEKSEDPAIKLDAALANLGRLERMMEILLDRIKR